MESPQSVIRDVRLNNIYPCRGGISSPTHLWVGPFRTTIPPPPMGWHWPLLTLLRWWWQVGLRDEAIFLLIGRIGASPLLLPLMLLINRFGRREVVVNSRLVSCCHRLRCTWQRSGLAIAAHNSETAGIFLWRRRGRIPWHWRSIVPTIFCGIIVPISASSTVMSVARVPISISLIP